MNAQANTIKNKKIKKTHTKGKGWWQHTQVHYDKNSEKLQAVKNAS